jgi:putative tryptophan/tyrosine transport system substrate-binding protein
LLGALGGFPAAAQQADKMYRVGILTSRSLVYDRPLLDGLRRSLAGMGYREGKNLEIIYRNAAGDIKQLPELATGLVRMNPDAIVAGGDTSIAAAKRATKSVPIVMAPAVDPVGDGFVVSLARPGGNITGVTNIEVELVSKQLQLLKELVPRARSVAVVRNPSVPASLAAWREAESVGHTIGIQAFALDETSADQLGAALKQHLRTDGILVLPDGVTLGNVERVVRLVAAQRLPALYPTSQFVVAGGLVSFASSPIGTWSQAATYVDRILKGAKPADLPVERPTTFELVVNLKTARALGITFPQSILLSADKVIR